MYNTQAAFIMGSKLTLTHIADHYHVCLHSYHSTDAPFIDQRTLLVIFFADILPRFGFSGQLLIYFEPSFQYF